MPRINRIRLGNIIYDHGKKHIGDICFSLGGQDTVFLLGNGGGKTLLAQLVLQTILPNARLGNRKLADLLQSQRFTGHVAVEWRLDSTGRAEQYLCTGFCFTNGLTPEEPIRYFNYLFDYETKGPKNYSLFGEEDVDGQLSITQLPFTVVDGVLGIRTPIGYQELWDWLEERKDQGVQLFRQQPKVYQDRLRVYQLYAEEWENIQKTNGTEGGVSRFFERAKTTTQLLDQLLIPSMEQVIYRSEERKKELLAGFIEHQNLLLQIPQIKQNIQDFNVIQDEAEGLVEEVKKLHNREVEAQRKAENLFRLAQGVYRQQQESSKRCAHLEEDLGQKHQTLRELKWQEASYEVFKQEQEVQRLREQLTLAQEELARRQDQLAKAQQEERKLHATIQYHRRQRAREEQEYYAHQLELLDKGEPELQEELETTSGKARFAWEKKREEFTVARQRTKEQLVQREETLQELQGRIQTQRTRLEELIDTMGRLKGWFEQYKAKEKQILVLVPDLNRLTPQDTLRQRQRMLDQLEKQTEACRKEIDNLTQEIRQWWEHNRELTGKLAILQGQLTGIQENLATFGRTKDQLVQLLHGAGIFIRDPFEEPGLLARVHSLWEEAQREWIAAQAKLASLEETAATITHSEYFVPHRELVAIQDYLARLDIPVILGSQWLQEHFQDETAREEFLKQEPLLPFSIVIEAGQVKTIGRYLRQMRDLSCEFPIILWVKGAPQRTTSQGELVSIGPREQYVFLPESRSLYTSPQAFQEFKERLQERINEQRNLVQGLRDREEERRYLKEQTQHFFRTYTKEQILQWQQQAEELTKQCAEREKEIGDTKARCNELEERQRLTQENLRDLVEKQHRLASLVADLEEFVQWYHQYQEHQATKAKVEREIAHLQQQRTLLEEATSRIQGEISAQRVQLASLDKALADHQRELVDLALDRTSPLATDEDYATCRAHLEAVKLRLAQKQVDRQNLEKLLAKANAEYAETQAQIQASGISEEILASEARPVSSEELAQQIRTRQELERDCRDQEKKVDSLESTLKGLEFIRDRLAAEVEREYQRPPYLTFDPATAQAQYQYLRERLAQVQGEIQDIQKAIDEERAWQQQLAIAGDLLREKVASLDKPASTDIPLDWRHYGTEPLKAIQAAIREQEEAADRVRQQQLEVRERFRKYYFRLQQTNNPKVNQFLRDVQALMDEDRIYNFDFVETQFLRIFEALDYYRRQAEETLHQCETSFHQLVQLSLRRAREVHRSIMELPKNSRVILYDQPVQVIRIEWPMQEEAQAQESMEQYLEKLLRDLQVWKAQGIDDDELNRRMEDMLSTRNLINVLAPIETCRVTVYKPRKESIARVERPEYFPWDEVTRWSGGEEYSVYITMFMIMLTHIRRQSEGLLHSWKVLLADNPFGVASSDHILDTMFQVARGNRIQLLCLTAHREASILKHFPTVYSLQLRPAYGKETLTAEQMEKGFYAEIST